MTENEANAFAMKRHAPCGVAYAQGERVPKWNTLRKMAFKTMACR